MGFSEAEFYVFNAGEPLGIRTNCGPSLWEGEVGDFIDACPEGWQIGFDIIERKPKEVARATLNYSQIIYAQS